MSINIMNPFMDVKGAVWCVFYEQYQVPQSAAHKAQNGTLAESNECRSV